jgi:hypothetical protein
MLTPTELKDIFRRVNDWAMEKSPLISKLELQIGCPQIAAHRKAGDKRAMFHVGHRKGKVCADPKALRLPVEFLVGLFLHEMGHPLAMKIYGKSEQWHADNSIKEILGVRIQYGGPLLLEYVAPSVADRILGR